jgi:hypothetical protein
LKEQGETVEGREGFGEASDAPIVETVGGQQVEFRLLTLDDLAAIARRAGAREADRALAELPLTAPAEQRDNVRRYYADREPDVRGLSALTQTLDGLQDFLRRSLCPPGGKGGKAATAKADATVQRLIRERGLMGAANLAARVSGLFAPPAPAVKEQKKDEPDPNAEAAG